MGQYLFVYEQNCALASGYLSKASLLVLQGALYLTPPGDPSIHPTITNSINSISGATFIYDGLFLHPP